MLDFNIQFLKHDSFASSVMCALHLATTILSLLLTSYLCPPLPCTIHQPMKLSNE